MTPSKAVRVSAPTSTKVSENPCCISDMCGGWYFLYIIYKASAKAAEDETAEEITFLAIIRKGMLST